MRILLVGAGGVGRRFAAIAARRDFFEAVVVADYDVARRRAGRGRWTTGSSPRRSTPPTPTRSQALVREHGITHVMNAVDPRFVMPIFDGAFAGWRRLPRHGDEPVAAAPGGAVREDRA